MNTVFVKKRLSLLSLPQVRSFWSEPQVSNDKRKWFRRLKTKLWLIFTYELLRRENLKAVMYLTIAMRQFVTFGGRILRRERKGFFTDFFLKYILRSFFRKFQMSYQHWGFYLWLIWIRKQQLDVSNQNRISMALLTSKHSLLKNIQLFISAPIEKRWLLMLSSVKLEI